MNVVVETRRLTKMFEAQAAVNGVSLCLEEGSIHAITGPNGAGKSTLLRLIIGLLKPDKGEILLFGEPRIDNPAVRQSIHYVSPEVNMYPLFRVDKVLHYARLLYEQWDERRCSRLMEALQIPAKKTIRQLSLGMKMRLRLVIALAAQARVLLLDEATNGIDPVTKEQIQDLLLQEVANRNTAILMATHHLSEIERMADTVSVLVDGSIIDRANLDDLREQYAELDMYVPPEGRARVLERLGPLTCEVIGSHISTMVKAEDLWLRADLTELGAEHIEVRAASVEKWLKFLLKREGVHNEKIDLSEGSPV